MTKLTEKRRARRIAADEAHAWARNLRLGNPGAKLVLSMLTQYINGDGHCFVSVQALAEDCEMVENTIRSRLKFLEEVGVIARFPQFIDEYGRRNSDGKGKRTTDEIRLLMGLDEERLEAQITARERDGASEVSPANREGLNTPQNDDASPPAGTPSSPAPALHQPFNCLQGLTSEPEPYPEPETPPLTPPQAGEVGAPEIDAIQEVEHFAEFWRAYPDHEVMSRTRALEIFMAMTPAERSHARSVALTHAEKLAKLKRKPKDAHKWLAEKGWQEYPQAKLPSERPALQRRLIRGREMEAVFAGMKIAGLRPPLTINTTNEETGRKADSIFWARAVGPDLLALVDMPIGDPKNCHQVTEGSREFGAWRERLQTWFGRDITGERIWLEPYNPDVHGLAGSHPNFKIRRFTKGFCVPRPFPPLVDGTWSPTTAPTADTGPPLMTEQDCAEFKA